MKHLIAFVLMVIYSASSLASTWEVRQDGSGDFASVSDALQIAVAGDEIRVWPGAYGEPTLVLDRDLVLVSEGGDEVTFLHGSNLQRVVYITSGATVSIQGFNIQFGFAYDGAGMHVDSGATATVTDCTFSYNTASYTGGASTVSQVGSVATFESCTFLYNSAPRNAGGVNITLQAEGRFNSCIFIGNSSTEFCGGIAGFEATAMTIENCIFVANEGLESGAIRTYMTPAVIRNNTFYRNTSRNDGTYTNHTTDNINVELADNIFCGDTMGVGVFSHSHIDETYNIYFDNYGGPTVGIVPANPSLLTDPYFCDAESNDFGLCADSPGRPAVNNHGLIGAVNDVCDPCSDVAEELLSWGSVKALYR